MNNYLEVLLILTMVKLLIATTIQTYCNVTKKNDNQILLPHDHKPIYSSVSCDNLHYNIFSLDFVSRLMPSIRDGWTKMEAKSNKQKSFS